MLLPIRCYTCGKVLAQLTNQWEKYKKELKEGEENWLPFFVKHNIRRYCCKRVLMAQVPDPNYDVVYDLPSSIVVSGDKVGNMFLAR